MLMGGKTFPGLCNLSTMYMNTGQYVTRKILSVKLN